MGDYLRVSQTIKLVSENRLRVFGAHRDDSLGIPELSLETVTQLQDALNAIQSGTLKSNGIYSVTYNENNNFIDITLANHKDAMIQTLESENLPIVKNTNYSVESIDLIGYQLGYLFANSMLEVLILAEMGCVDAFSQDAVERQKNFLK